MARIDYEKLLRSVSIDDVAKRLGMELRAETSTRFKSLCPFHDDKTPSLLIDSSRSEGRQHFHCFACGAHGDVIELVKGRLNVGFKDAVDWLSPDPIFTEKITPRKYGTRVSPIVSGNQDGLMLGYSLYKEGANHPNFETWIKERRLDSHILRRAGFVYAPSNFLSRQLDGMEDISSKREKAGFLEDAYLIRKFFPGVAAALHLPLNSGNSATVGYSDFFIGERIIFPLYDDKKQLAGLAARSVQTPSNSTTPKYQFTRGFPKATVLYRAEYAFEQIRKESKQGKTELFLYLCEGFLDALRIEALGRPAVAVMGSSISDQQIQLLNRLYESLPAKDAKLTVIICFDRDEAGLRGAADACSKLLHTSFVECQFAWPTELQLTAIKCQPTDAKDPNDYLADLSSNSATELLTQSVHTPILAILAHAFGVTADDTLNNKFWNDAPRSRQRRAFTRAFNQLKKVKGEEAGELITRASAATPEILALKDWKSFLDKAASTANRSLPEEFLNDAQARLNHARILAYMGSQRGELPCDEPRWERLDIAATAFNALLEDRLKSSQAEPIGPYDAVWVPRSFGGTEHRLKMMPRPEDLIIQQYLLNEILTERWDQSASSPHSTFSRMIPAVRYYREERRTVTTGFDVKDNGSGGELNSRTLSFAYQIDMDVVEGRQPASDQGMYRPFNECWRDFMKSISQQASDIGYVYSIRLDAKRYYDRLRQYVVRDRLLSKLKFALDSVFNVTPGFAELLDFQDMAQAADKAATILDRLGEHLFGVTYNNPDTGLKEKTASMVGIPQGPVLSAWIGSIALFPVDEVANQFLEKHNTETLIRVGYARYVDDIVLLADSPFTLLEMREAIDVCARNLELTLIAKAEEIPPMSAEEFATYINQGRAFAASGPSWEPPLVGDGESGWGFWSVAPTTDRQSALQLLHNVELYKTSQATLLQTVKTAFQAPDLRTSELSKAARLLWYSIAFEQAEHPEPTDVAEVWKKYLDTWNVCLQGSSWQMQPEKNMWESPVLFALEGLEHLLDTKTRDVAELSADENSVRRKRIVWLAKLVLLPGFDSPATEAVRCPQFQLRTRFKLIRWKAIRITGQETKPDEQQPAERSELIKYWKPFEWMHEAISLLSKADKTDEDPLQPFVVPATEQRDEMTGTAATLFTALLPDSLAQSAASSGDSIPQLTPQLAGIALQTLVSTLPRDQLLNCLNRRPSFLWTTSLPESQDRLILPPLPGMAITRLFSCVVRNIAEKGIVVARGIQAIELGKDNLPSPEFIGADNS